MYVLYGRKSCLSIDFYARLNQKKLVGCNKYSMLIYYVYAYLRLDGTPYYFGKGKGNRAYRHFKGEVQPPKDKSRVVFLETCLSDIGALALERRMIKWYGRKDLGTGILRNKTEGGEGAAGLVVSEETRKKASESNKVTWAKEETMIRYISSMQGVWSSSERNAKISASTTGEKNHRFSKPSPNRGIPLSNETRAKMSKAAKTRPAYSQEYKDAASMRMKKKWADPEYRANMLASKTIPEL